MQPANLISWLLAAFIIDKKGESTHILEYANRETN